MKYNCLAFFVLACVATVCLSAPQGGDNVAPNPNDPSTYLCTGQQLAPGQLLLIDTPLAPLGLVSTLVLKFCPPKGPLYVVLWVYENGQPVITAMVETNLLSTDGKSLYINLNVSIPILSGTRLGFYNQPSDVVIVLNTPLTTPVTNLLCGLTPTVAAVILAVDQLGLGSVIHLGADGAIDLNLCYLPVAILGCTPATLFIPSLCLDLLTGALVGPLQSILGLLPPVPGLPIIPGIPIIGK